MTNVFFCSEICMSRNKNSGIYLFSRVLLVHEFFELYAIDSVSIRIKNMKLQNTQGAPNKNTLSVHNYLSC